MSVPPTGTAGTHLADAVAKVIDFAAATGHPAATPVPDSGPAEAEASRNDRSIVVRATADEGIAIELSEPIRQRPAELAALILEATNEALAAARAAQMEQFAGMPDLATLQSNLAGLRREVLDGYRQEMARLEQFTTEIARD